MKVTLESGTTLKSGAEWFPRFVHVLGGVDVTQEAGDWPMAGPQSHVDIVGDRRGSPNQILRIGFRACEWSSIPCVASR